MTSGSSNNNTPLRWGKGYNDSRESEKRLETIVSDVYQFNLPSNPTAMDLGANTGFFSYGLAATGFDVTAVEPPNDHVYDETRIWEHRQWVHNGEDLPDGPFDVSLVLSVLHHIPNWTNVLAGVLARTRSLVYVEVPHPDERHPKWHGSTQSLEYLYELDATQIGEHYESTHRRKRPLFRIEL